MDSHEPRITVTDEKTWYGDARIIITVGFDLESCHGCGEFSVDLPAGEYRLVPVAEEEKR